MAEIYVDQTLYIGRPAKKRSETQERIYDALDKAKIPYERADHDCADTIEYCHAVEQVLKAHVAKNLFLCNSQKTSFYMLVMPGEKPFRTKDLSKQINSARLSFAPAELMEKYLATKPGSLSILGLINDSESDVRLLIDKDVLSYSYLGFHPCENTSTLRLKTSDILERFLPLTQHIPTFVEL